ncbi:MAG: hypothetical protein SO044_08935 [Agathobaculum sp.]|uniref:hypothetical protein n=1 Tax=Agathobaculum sp. TaxID=2048138 RepID=UPI0025B98BF4|nr:hypothetical protein [Agathobaculum sp.]MDY3712519.1 hypothetical protein [Agathobaculum sp.]
MEDTVMEEQSTGFRGAFFGGFRREDVLRYIEQTDGKYHTETGELRRQLAEAQAALSELREQNEQLTVKNAELLERLGEMTIDADKIRAKLDDIERGFTMQTAEIEAQSVRAGELAAENDRLIEENAKLAAKCGEYDASKEKIAEMELSAYRRAKQLEEDTKNEMVKLRRQSMEMIGEVKRQLDTAKENYRIVLARSQQESAEMARKAGEVLGEIDRIAASLGGKDDKSKNGLRDVLNNLRPRAEE